MVAMDTPELGLLVEQRIESVSSSGCHQQQKPFNFDVSVHSTISTIEPEVVTVSPPTATTSQVDVTSGSTVVPVTAVTPRVSRPSLVNQASLNIPLIEIEEFVETTIVLKKDKKNELGISVVGGNDTYLETICVSVVHPDGNAFRDGRLKCGDILLAVNDHSLRDLSWADALKLLRDAASPVRIVVLRENPHLMFTTPNEPTKYVTVELRKVAVTDRLGLSIMHGNYNGNGVFVTWVRPGSLAARQGRILQGDRILEVNGQNVRQTSQQELAASIRNLDGAIVLLLGRVPVLTHSIQEWARMKVGSPGRIRTSTWSYTAKEKLQSQRPSLPATSGGNKEPSYELLVPMPIPFPIPPPGTATTSRFGGWAVRASDAVTGSPRRSSAIANNMRRTMGPEGVKIPLVVPLKIDEELLLHHSPIREKITCPKIQVTNC